MRVSDVVKRKILGGEFVEMADVLEVKAKSVTPQAPNWGPLAPGQMIITQEPVPPKRSLSISDWVTAFTRFIYVHLDVDANKYCIFLWFLGK